MHSSPSRTTVTGLLILAASKPLRMMLTSSSRSSTSRISASSNISPPIGNLFLPLPSYFSHNSAISAARTTLFAFHPWEGSPALCRKTKKVSLPKKGPTEQPITCFIQVTYSQHWGETLLRPPYFPAIPLGQTPSSRHSSFCIILSCRDGD